MNTGWNNDIQKKWVKYFEEAKKKRTVGSAGEVLANLSTKLGIKDIQYLGAPRTSRRTNVPLMVIIPQDRGKHIESLMNTMGHSVYKNPDPAKNASEYLLKISNLPPPGFGNTSGRFRAMTPTNTKRIMSGAPPSMFINGLGYGTEIDLVVRLRAREISLIQNLGPGAPVVRIEGAWLVPPVAFVTLMPMYRRVQTLYELLTTNALTPKHVKIFEESVMYMWRHGVHIGHTSLTDILVQQTTGKMIFTDLKYGIKLPAAIVGMANGSSVNTRTFWDNVVKTEKFDSKVLPFMQTKLGFPRGQNPVSDIDIVRDLYDRLQHTPRGRPVMGRALNSLRKFQRRILPPMMNSGTRDQRNTPSLKLRNIRESNDGKNGWQPRLYGKVWATPPEQPGAATRTRRNNTVTRNAINNARGGLSGDVNFRNANYGEEEKNDNPGRTRPAGLPSPLNISNTISNIIQSRVKRFEALTPDEQVMLETASRNTPAIMYMKNAMSIANALIKKDTITPEQASAVKTEYVRTALASKGISKDQVMSYVTALSQSATS